MPEINFKLMVITDGADGKLHAVEQNLDAVKKKAEDPKEVKLNAEQSLATIRDLGLAVGTVFAALGKLTAGINGFMDASLGARQSQSLANLAFKEGSQEIQEFASKMQGLTNFEDDQLTALMSKLSQTFKMHKDEIMQLTPMLLDFTEANKATGMTVESAFDLMGRALNGHTEMLGRYGIELDKTRLQTEGVSYLVEKLGVDYGGTAEALADLRLQNRNAWGDIQETVGAMLDTLISPLLKGMKALMDWFQELPKGLQGLVAGLALAVPTVIALATAFTTLTAAFTALKAAINPIAGIISLVVGGLTAAGVAIAATATNTNTAAKAHSEFTEEVKQAAAEVSMEAEKFNLLASRMLELKNKTELTREEKQELGAIISGLNSNYGQYLGNINMETASYNQLRDAVNQANDALLNKMNAQVYENLLMHQVGKLAIAKVDLSNKMNELLNVKVPSTQDNFMTVAYAQLQMLEERFSDWQNNPTYQAIRSLYDQVKAETNSLANATEEYNNAVSGLKQMKSTTNEAGGGIGAGSAEVNEYENLMAELERLRNSELENLEADYKKKLAIIKQYTVDQSAEETNAITELDNWKTDQEQKISDKMSQLQSDALAKKKQAEQEKFRTDIEYYSNLESLGVASWDALKQTMSDYYEWAKENLSKEEQAMILIQMRETNLRIGQVREAERQKEIAEQQELERIRDEFATRDLEMAGNSYQIQLNAIDRYYATRKQKMIEAGITEQAIEKQKAEAISRLQITNATEMAKGVGGVLGNMAALQDKESESGFKTWKALALAQAMVDMPASALAAYKSQAGIPIIGPALGIAAAAVAVAAGLKNIEQIKKTKYEKKELGGPIEGPSHALGGTIIEAEGGEYIARKSRVTALGRRFFDWINFAPITEVLSGLGNFTIPIPNDGYRYATGGQVDGGSNVLNAILNAINNLAAKTPAVIQITVDPLGPVKVSELNDQGKLLRSGV